MAGFHHRHRSGYGWGPYAATLPAYAVISEKATDCACENKSGALPGLEKWVKDNPILSLIGVFALGWFAAGKKGR